MKRLFILACVFSALTFINLPTLQADDQHKHQESAQVRFNETYKLKGALLFGDYLVIHDDEKKARGEECIFFYRVKSDNTKELVVSYRCEAVERAKAETFKIVATHRRTPYDLAEIQEIQFAGSTSGHRIP
jgi:hypothetical protein